MYICSRLLLPHYYILSWDEREREREERESVSLCPPCSGCGEGAKICDESSSAARHFSFRKPGGFTGEGQKSRCETGRKLYPICHCQTPLLSLSLSLCWSPAAGTCALKPRSLWGRERGTNLLPCPPPTPTPPSIAHCTVGRMSTMKMAKRIRGACR